MRLFLIWADNSSGVVDMVKVLKKHRHEVIYWVGENGADLSELSDVIFHDHYDAWAGRPAQDVDPNKFPPATPELIKKMRETESLILTMMNKHFDQLCVDERRNIYYDMLRYWDGLLTEHKPEAVVFANVPHTVYNYLIYKLALLKGIKTLMFEDTWLGDRLLDYREFEKGSGKLIELLAENKGAEYKAEDLSPDLRDYYLEQISKCDRPPFQMKISLAGQAGWEGLVYKLKIARGILFGLLSPRTLVLGLKKRIGKNLRKEYQQLESTPDLEKDYVYLPLHYQPELTTSPLADLFVDQILMIETLSAALPAGWKIYVKEHPSQWWLRTGVKYNSCRYPGYYRRLAAIKNVQLVPITTNSFELIKHSRAVASATGTACWEALLREKPALIFGYPWFRDCPEVFRVDSTVSCRAALEKVNQGCKVDRRGMINYLKCLDEATIHAYLYVGLEETSGLSQKDSWKNLTALVLQKLESL